MPNKGASVVTLGLALFLGAAEVQAQEVQQWIAGWEGEAPAVLRADWRGPFGTRRFHHDVVLERFSPGLHHEVKRIRAPIGYPAFAFVPDLVRTDRNPELFFRDEVFLQSDLEPRHAEAIGEADWEYYSAAREGNNLFSAAFGILDDGFSFVTLVAGGREPLVAELRSGIQGVWAPRTFLKNNLMTVVFRGVTPAPGRGYGIQIETMSVGAFQAAEEWQPSRRSFQPDDAGMAYGDPAACLDEAGNVHWAAVIWNNRTFRPTGRIVVDGVELVQRGFSGNVDWLPDLEWVKGQGLVLSIAGPTGNAQVGRVVGNQFQILAELPSVAPAYGEPPPTRLTAYNKSFYVSTSEGLWAYHVPIPVPAGSLPLLGGLAVAVLALGRRRLMRASWN